jgi:hypothetical protein
MFMMSYPENPDRLVMITSISFLSSLLFKSKLYFSTFSSVMVGKGIIAPEGQDFRKAIDSSHLAIYFFAFSMF